MPKPLSVLIWILVSLAGAGSFAFLALGRGEHVSAAWLVTAAVCTYLVAYRFYSRIIAANIFALDASGKATIVEENEDECVLCNLCVEAAPPGSVRVVKLYEG